tara:strand:+ start:1434 stop:1727 length:294 start_codon:yes stop_codon:yes gene_type:complete
MDRADLVAGALCDVMERALIDSGIAPDLARELAKRACVPTVAGATRTVAKKAKRVNRKLSKAFAEANRRLRTKSGKLRRGMTQSDVAKLAHRLAKKL